MSRQIVSNADPALLSQPTAFVHAAPPDDESVSAAKLPF